MTLPPRLDEWMRGWRGVLFAAMVALFAGLPGLIVLPVLDRDEARFAQSTAQMLETGDVIDIRFQDQDRSREPPLLHWLQAASVTVFSSTEAREIWTYRLPSLLGAMLAAGACAWGAAAFLGPGGAALAGAILGGCLILSTEAAIGKADAVLCGLATLAMAALGRLYQGAGSGGQDGGASRTVFWLSLAAAILDEGLAAPMIAAVTALTLWAWDRRAPWMRNLGWTWGLIILAALVGPWLAAATVRSDGEVWRTALSSEFAGLGPGGRAPLGLHALVAPVLLFPFAALLPAALLEGWKARGEPGLRFALCWLVPNWLILEASPSRQIHLALPLYGALAWLAAAAAARPWGPVTRIAGAAVSIGAALAVAAAAALLTQRYGAPADWTVALAVGAAALASGACGAFAAISNRARLPTLAGALVLGIGAHAAFVAILAPRLQPLWLADRVADALDRTGINPRDGLTPGPVSVAGFAEPSIVFSLGTGTELGEADDAAAAISEGRPAVVERTAVADFEKALAVGGWKASQVAQVDGLDYVSGRATSLHIYRSDSPPPVGAPASAAGAVRSAASSTHAAHERRPKALRAATRKPREAKR
jgi:4-amino-4-deoxy-L-arabinose transferase-like glycosyltransferase